MSDWRMTGLAVGGCARDQSTTQFCGEAVAAHKRISELEAGMREIADHLSALDTTAAWKVRRALEVTVNVLQKST